MLRIITIIVAVMTFLMADAETFSYQFNSTPLPKAIREIMEGHPELDINFIYNELETYKTSATVKADDAYDALRQTIGLNPVTVVRSRNTYYLEALQHGKYVYTGKAVGTDSEAVVAATVMLLAPKDSTVLTYGITNDAGQFTIPCDRQGVIAKLSCMGYKTSYILCKTFNIGTIIMPEQAVNLSTVSVEAANSQLYADRSIYIPTQRQKNASQSGNDLLAHMAIPQIDALSGGSVTTNTGKPVAIFIDYVPASDKDLKAMRTADVKRVEYYELPSDPRLQGNQYAVNFIMQQYEYGGYVKGFGHANLISFSEQLLGNMRFQYKKMTYDIMGYGFNMNNSHYGSNLRETFRLPKEDGGNVIFDRISRTLSSKTENQQYFAAFRALYNSDNIQASTEIDGSINTTPLSYRNGIVEYSSEIFPSMPYYSISDKDSRFLSYSGYYFFVLPKDNSLTFTPHYTFTHSENNSSYSEADFSSIINSASDNTSQIKGDIKFSHSFGKYGTILAAMDVFHEYNRTRYFVGVRYRAKFYAQILSGILIVLSGLMVDNLHGFFFIESIPVPLAMVLTVFAMVLIVNAVNLIDGIDGLASGLCGIALLFYGVVFYLVGDMVDSLIAFAALGTLVPFFYYNVFGDAKMGKKIFMGDTGALTTGTILGILMVRMCMIERLDIVDMNPIVLAYSPLIVPCFDVVRVYLHRVRAGRNPFLPDKSHIHHKLLALGMKQRVAMPTILLISVVFVCLNIILSQYINSTIVLLIDTVVWILFNMWLTRRIQARERRLNIPIENQYK